MKSVDDIIAEIKLKIDPFHRGPNNSILVALGFSACRSCYRPGTLGVDVKRAEEIVRNVGRIFDSRELIFALQRLEKVWPGEVRWGEWTVVDNAVVDQNHSWILRESNPEKIKERKEVQEFYNGFDEKEDPADWWKK